MQRLMLELGYTISDKTMQQQTTAYIQSKTSMLIVSEIEGGGLTGLIAGHLIPLIHQAGNVGRITALVVPVEFQKQGVGSALVEAIESWFLKNNCLRFEVTSGEHREAAHHFYKARGYISDEHRFIKQGAT